MMLLYDYAQRPGLGDLVIFPAHRQAGVLRQPDTLLGKVNEDENIS